MKKTIRHRENKANAAKKIKQIIELVARSLFSNFNFIALSEFICFPLANSD